MKKTRKADKIRDIKHLRIFTSFLWRLNLCPDGPFGLATAKYFVERVWEYHHTPINPPDPDVSDLITKIKCHRTFMAILLKLSFKQPDVSLYGAKLFVDSYRAKVKQALTR